MQFHLNGFKPGDPDIAEPAEQLKTSEPSDALPGEVDVLIADTDEAGHAFQ